MIVIEIALKTHLRSYDTTSRTRPLKPEGCLEELGEGCGQTGLWHAAHHRESGNCCSPVVKVSNHGRHVMSSIPVPLKTRRVGQRCTLNLSRAETSSRWCGVVVRRGGASSGVVHVT
ncbi:uncharacterized protein TNCV_4338641 [Trichonephila clavipes]|nr:uncharacterized protein TNCV_4338641 [Trichonephila clavipes]